MKKILKPVSCALVAIFALSLAPNSPKLGPFGADTVSAATAATPATPVTPAKPVTPVKTTTPAKVVTPVKTTTPAKTATPVKVVATTTSVGVTRILKLNSTGNDVKLLQTSLNSNGYKLTVDGIFGNATLVAVKNYQGKNGLVADGIVGPATLAKLNAKVATPVKVITPPVVKTPVVKTPVVVPPVVVPPVVEEPVVVPPVDVVTTASLVNTAAAFEKSIGKDGPWIISTLKDLTTTKDLVLEGAIYNTKTPPALQRKISLYTQDDDKNVIDRFTLTAPKLTILSPNARIQGGTFKGDIYVSVANFQLVDAVVDGNVYFTTEEAKTTFKVDAKSVVRGNRILTEVDAISTASLVRDEAAFIKAISKEGTWIPCILNDLTTKKELVLDGEFKNGKKDPVTGAELIQRKIGLYSQDDKRVVTRRFTLTAPKLTINSPLSSIQGGIFKGNVYVNSTKFALTDATIIGDVYISATNVNLTKNAKIQGNVYFSTPGAKDTFKMDATSSVTGKQELLVVDAIATASIVTDAVALEKAMGTEVAGGKWIICSLNDITTTKELVLEGEFKKASTDLLPQRKIGLYTQAKEDGKNVVLKKFTLTAPKLTIKSPNAKIQSSIFKGDLYVSVANFQLQDAKVDGNVYFTTQEAKDTFKMDAKSSITGVQELKLN